MLKRKIMKNFGGYQCFITPFLIAKMVAAFMISSAALFIACSLVTFSPLDQSWFFMTTDSISCHNSMGSWGCLCASLLIFLFGGAAYCLIPLLLGCSYNIMIRKLNDYDRWIGYFLLTCSYAGLLSAYKYDVFLTSNPGGYVGRVVYEVARGLFDDFLATTFLLVLFAIGLLLIADYALLLVARKLMIVVSFLCNKEKFLKPLAHTLSITITTIYGWWCSVVRAVWNLLNGSEVHNDDHSIVSFEQVVEQEWFSRQEQDMFWETLFHKNVKLNVDDQEESMQKSSCKQEPSFESQQEEQPITSVEHTDNHIEQEVSFQSKVIPFCLPPAHLFATIDTKVSYQEKAKQLQLQAAALEEKLECFGIRGKVIAIKVGPVITLFEYEPTIESKISKIIALEDDLALALQAMSIRIIAPIPGRSVVGFEVANKQRSDVWLANALHAPEFKESKEILPIILGQDTVGDIAVIDLTKAPHLLVAGSTGSGKSSALNGMLISLLFKYAPDQLKLILIDPKRLEFSIYGRLPHLLFPIITDSRKAILTLKWLVKTMEERYAIMEQMSVRNIMDYQALAKKDSQLQQLPFIVVMIDELSDLIMTTGKEVEDLIVRIAQMARAAGIHMIVATQRPSVDVVTGLIKANFPSRVSFRVTSKVDSRTILDCSGAEKLLGKGDMLYLDLSSHLRRIHGAYVSMHEIEQLISFIGAQQEPAYIELQEDMLTGSCDVDQADELLIKEIIPFLETVDTVSISSLQRRFRIGYNRSARIIELLESEGLIMQDPAGKARKVVRSR